MLDFKKEVIAFKLDGKESEIRKPTNLEIREYSKSLKDCKEESEKEAALIEFLCGLGLTKEVYDNLTPSNLKTLLEALHESEKN